MYGAWFKIMKKIQNVWFDLLFLFYKYKYILVDKIRANMNIFGLNKNGKYKYIRVDKKGEYKYKYNDKYSVWYLQIQIRIFVTHWCPPGL